MQAIELALGILPREYKSWDEVQGWHRELIPLLPTPTRRDHNGRGYPNATSPALPNVGIEQLLPTPVAHDDGKTPEAHLAMKRRMGHGRKAITSLGVMAQTWQPIEPDDKLLPTPKANDGKGATITHGRFRPDGRPYLDGDANLPLVAQELPLLPTPLSGEARHGSPGQHRTRGDKMLTGEVLNLLATPGAYDGERGGPQDPAKRRAGGHYVTLQDQACFELLPTPSVSDGTGGHISRSGDRKHELLLPGIAQKLLPTPRVIDARTKGNGPRPDTLTGVVQYDENRQRRHEMAVEWGVYEPAIRRWEYIRGIEAPCPVEPGQKGNMRLAPPFVEWMMGLPPGWVTEVEGLSRAKQLKLLGNGVVPQQVYYALRELLGTLTLLE